MRIATWSGPRNLSTAMMYSFGNRPDVAVVDEPFYAAYLKATGLGHPMREEVLKSQPIDPTAVAKDLSGPIPEGKPHFYQKHMAHHMLPDVPRDWMKDAKHVFLIRNPARVVSSFSAGHECPGLLDIGVVQQVELRDHVVALGQTPLIVDSADIRANPRGMLQTLCEALALNWDEAMLSWPKGGHRADGVWAKHWYGSVHQSTGFAGAEGDLPKLEGEAAKVVEEAMPAYRALARDRLLAR